MVKFKFIFLSVLTVSFAVLYITLFTVLPKVFAATTRVDLLSADNFAVLAGSGISDTGTTTIIGDVGLSPTGGTAITGLTCAEVTGTIYDTNAGYAGGGGGSTACLITDPSLLTTAKNDLVTAYNDAAGRTTTSTIATELGGTTLTDGVYDSNDGTFELTGTVTLDGAGDPDSVFIFKMASTLTTASASQVVLTNGAQACNVYWQVGSSATLGTTSTLRGNLLALTSITDDGGSTILGRLLARDGAVTLNNTTITVQTCAGATAGTSVNSISSDQRCVATTPDAPQWAYISATTGGVNLFWSAMGGSRVDIQIANGSGEFVYQYTQVPNDGHMFLPNVSTGQSVRIRVFNECTTGDWLVASTTPALPNTGFGTTIKNVPGYVPAGIFIISALLVRLIH